MSRICIVTAGHLATTPRMLKAADALAEAGHQVRVVSTRFLHWASHADGDLHNRRHSLWHWDVVDYSPSDPMTRNVSGLRRRGAEALAAVLTPERCPAGLAYRAYSRVHPELVRTILTRPEELIYAGTAGALAAAAVAAGKTGTPYALDLEDLHSGEQDDSPQARRAHRLARRIEGRVLPGAIFRTAGSAALASTYRDLYGLKTIAIHNTFPLPTKPPVTTCRKPGTLRLYWFSQTIGPNRGLEEAILAAGKAGQATGTKMELHLRGQRPSSYVESLRRLAGEVAPKLRLKLHDPEPPDRMIELCAAYDVGLALEQAHVLNRALCLSNKPLTYLLAGLAIAFTDTPGQRPLAEDIGRGGSQDALIYPPGDADALAAGLARWARKPAALAAARAASWRAARNRWHWHHPLERGALLQTVASALASRTRRDGARR